MNNKTLIVKERIMNITESHENYLTALGFHSNNGLKKQTINNNNPEKHRPYKRIFGQDISNVTSLTENQVNDSKLSFLQAINIIKENQAKHQIRHSINQNMLFHSSILKTEKQKDINSSIPNEIKPILTRGNFYYQNNDFNSEKKANPQNVPEYQDDIYSFYMQIEKTYSIDHHYMKNQHDINEKMREILIDWLVDVHTKFKLVHETLFLAVNIIDRYLSFVDVNRKNLQLVGVAALFIACKYEEIYPPEIRHFTYITDNAYEKKHVLLMESDILKQLHFDLSIPSSLRYLEIFHYYIHLSEIELVLCKYLLELSLLNYKSIIFSPGILAVSTIITAKRLLNTEDNYIELLHLCSYDNNTINNCSEFVYGLVQNKNDDKFKKKVKINAVFLKYSSKKYMEISLLKYEAFVLDHIFN